MNIEIFSSKKFPGRALLLSFARAVCKTEKILHRPGKIALIFVSAKKLRQINVQFLGHDYDTDVISFPYAAPRRAVSSDFPFGDIYISMDMARAQAKAGGHNLNQELALMVLHGLLHLAGYKDHLSADRRKMFRRQRQLFHRCLPHLPYPD